MHASYHRCFSPWFYCKRCQFAKRQCQMYCNKASYSQLGKGWRHERNLSTTVRRRQWPV